MKSLAEALGVADPKDPDAEVPTDWQTLEGKEFCDAVLKSPDFRTYIVCGLRLGTLPSAVLCRVMDHAWGKPPDKIEHTGKDGQPIQHVTEVRRTIVHILKDEREPLELPEPAIDGEVAH